MIPILNPPVSGLINDIFGDSDDEEEKREDEGDEKGDVAAVSTPGQ